jgi:hypothetical protein
MVQGCEELGLAFKTGHTVGVIGELGREGFYSDFTSELGVPGTPHLTHTALPEGSNDFIVRKTGTGTNHP